MLPIASTRRGYAYGATDPNPGHNMALDYIVLARCYEYCVVASSSASQGSALKLHHILGRLPEGRPGAGHASARAQRERLRRAPDPDGPHRVPRLLLTVGRDHLEQALRVYVKHYNQHRPRRALGLPAPNQSSRSDLDTSG